MLYIEMRSCQGIIDSTLDVTAGYERLWRRCATGLEAGIEMDSSIHDNYKSQLGNHGRGISRLLDSLVGIRQIVSLFYGRQGKWKYAREADRMTHSFFKSLNTAMMSY
jgi:hypothetical protein